MAKLKRPSPMERAAAREKARRDKIEATNKARRPVKPVTSRVEIMAPAYTRTSRYLEGF